MNSKERHEIRYQRRKAKRIMNKQMRSDNCLSYEELFTFNKLFTTSKKACRGIRWKQSTQNFERHKFSISAKLHNELTSEQPTYKMQKYKHFTISERGKTREVDAPQVRDKVVQKLLSQQILQPLYEPIMVYNNGASQKGKGMSFTRKLLKRDLCRHFKKYGKNGYLILIDFSQFFPSAEHSVILERHETLIGDKKVRMVLDQIVNASDRGMPLGIEPSQYEMIAFPSKLDNYINCQLHIKGFGRYMDDYYVLVNPHQDPIKVLDAIREKAKQIGMKISEKKTKILPFGKKFTFCKVRYIILDSGKIITRGCAKNNCIARHKMKMFARLWEAGQCKIMIIWDSVHSHLAYLAQFNNHREKHYFCQMFYSLFGFSCEEYQNFKCRKI